MTLSQIRTYIRSVTKKQIQNQIENTSLMALASQGEGKSIKKAIGEMTKILTGLEDR